MVNTCSLADLGVADSFVYNGYLWEKLVGRKSNDGRISASYCQQLGFLSKEGQVDYWLISRDAVSLMATTQVRPVKVQVIDSDEREANAEVT